MRSLLFQNEDEEIIDDGGLYPPSEDEEFKRVVSVRS